MRLNRKTVFDCIVLIVGCLLLGNAIRLMKADGGQRNVTVEDGLRVSPAVADLGKVKQGKTSPVVFTFENIGSRRIEDISIVPSCGCTIAACDKRTLSPAQSTQAKGEFDSRKRRGHFVSHLLLAYTVDGVKRQRLLQFQADVEPFVDVNPTAIHFSSESSTEHTSTKQMVTFSADDAKFEIVEVSCWHPAFSVREVNEKAFPSEGCQVPSDRSRLKRVEVVLNRAEWNSLPQSEKESVSLRVLTSINTEPELIIPITVD